MRVLLRVLSPLFGLAVAVLGVLLAAEAAWALLRPSSVPLLVPWPAWRDVLAGVAWSRTPVLLAGAGLVLLGLALGLLAATARRRQVAMRAPADEVTVVTSPRSLAHLVGRQVRRADGVRSASVTASARRVTVRATSAVRTAQELRPALLATVNDLVTALPLARKPKVQVVVDARRDAA